MTARSTFVGASDLAPLFAGLKFDLMKMRVVLPDGRLLNRAQFDVAFGGLTFALDAGNEHTTRSAWMAFTQSPVFRPPMV